MEKADLLLNIFDISSRQLEQQMAMAENLLVRLELSRMAVVRDFNKVDLDFVEYAWTQGVFYRAIPVYANEKRL